MKKKVLLIEDDVIVRENTAEILRFANFEVVTASDGKAGVEKARKHQPDIIVCDIMMPKLDCYGVFQILSKDDKLSDVPFIFLTAKTNHSDRRKGMSLGADDYISKPFEESELLAAIDIRLNKVESLKSHFSNSSKIDETNISDTTVRDINELIKIFCKKPTQIYQKGDSLYCEGNRSNHLFLVKNGLIKTFKSTEDGKELITGFYKEKEFIGYTSSLGDFSHSENAEAIKESKIIKIEKSEIISILTSNSSIAMDLLELLAKNIKKTRDKLVEVAYDSVRRRTARSLLTLVSEDPLDKITITRANLANLTGVAKETLIRTLSDFKDEGYIETERNSVKIINKKALKQIQ